MQLPLYRTNTPDFCELYTILPCDIHAMLCPLPSRLICFEPRTMCRHSHRPCSYASRLHARMRVACMCSVHFCSALSRIFRDARDVVWPLTVRHPALLRRRWFESIAEVGKIVSDASVHLGLDVTVTQCRCKSTCACVNVLCGVEVERHCEKPVG